MSPGLTDLIQQARNEDSVLRGQAAEQLGQFDDSRAKEALAGLLLDPDAVVRFKAAVALAWTRDDRGAEVLVWALGRSEFCFASLQALTELGSPKSTPQVRRFFRRWHLHPLERVQAAAALHRCGDSEGSEFLRQCLESSRSEERGYAIELWGQLNMPGALDFLQGVLSDTGESHRIDAVRGLVQLGDTRCLPLLRRIARQQEDSILAEEAASAIEALAEDREGGHR